MAKQKAEANKTPRNVILCDDVRQEGNGKYLLIGVYSGDILLPVFPAGFAPALYVEWEVTGAGEFDFSVSYYVEDELRAELKGKLAAKRDGTVAWALPGVLIEATAECELRVDGTIDRSEPVTLVRKKIRLNPDAPPTVSPPPS